MKINEETVPNKYLRWFCYILMFKYVWDITTLLEKYLPMQKVYKVLGLGWTKLGYYVFWLLWFIMIVVGLYHILGEETFNALVDEL